jgi:hypothetical protein
MLSAIYRIPQYLSFNQGPFPARHDIVNEDFHEAAARLVAYFSCLTLSGLHDRQEPSCGALGIM